MSHPLRSAVEPDEVPVLFAGAELADAPPFGAQRIPAEQRILGARHVYRGPVLCLVGEFGPLESFGMIIEILRALVEKIRERLVAGAVATDEEKGAYVKVALLVLYAEVDGPLQILADTNVLAREVYFGFVARRAHFLDIEGLVIDLPCARILFAVFYQIRRAYFIIHTTLLGISPASAELRNRVWYTLFPAGDLLLHGMWGYANRSDVTVLILGETGTGKEGVAWALSYGRWIPCDDRGRFKDRPDQGFHAVNLAGLSDSLADAQLVGYRKGAFTGAFKNTPGALDQCAEGRNLFIDEVGAASLAIQNKLLRIVEEKKFTPLGGSEQVLLLGRLLFAARALGVECGCADACRLPGAGGAARPEERAARAREHLVRLGAPALVAMSGRAGPRVAGECRGPGGDWEGLPLLRGDGGVGHERPVEAGACGGAAMASDEERGAPSARRGRGLVPRRVVEVP